MKEELKEYPIFKNENLELKDKVSRFEFN